MTSTANILRRARMRANLSQTELAGRSGIPQSSISQYESDARHPTTPTLERLLSRTGSQLVSAQSRHPSIAAVAEQIAVELKDGRLDGAYRAFLSGVDALREETPLNRVLLAVEEPAFTGDARLDAALAGVVELFLSRDGSPLPDWIEGERRFLSAPWFVDDSPYGRSHDPEQTNHALRRRNVILPDDGLTAA